MQEIKKQTAIIFNDCLLDNQNYLFFNGSMLVILVVTAAMLVLMVSCVAAFMYMLMTVSMCMLM